MSLFNSEAKINYHEFLEKCCDIILQTLNKIIDFDAKTEKPSGADVRRHGVLGVQTKVRAHRRGGLYEVA